MTKFDDLTKRRDRLNQEIEKTEAAIQNSQLLLKKKQQALQAVNSEIITAMLVDKGMTITDLEKLLGNVFSVPINTEAEGVANEPVK
ncbi:hypothetical protein [Lactovum miscens]|uniref:DUF4315 family protein n=1 Tax=Lactovum miscens TaxID=190387 RepID=A0A841C5G5_9LACT|nr:hypothetical protein [Lactovum miscens]MBB5887594.1 hypothetical protein [Lactovum miscens]